MPSYSGDHGETGIRFPGKGIFLREKATGKCHPLNYLIAKIKYSVEHKVQAFKKVKYSEKSKNAHITDVAIADIDVAGIQKKVALVYIPDAGGALGYFHPIKRRRRDQKIKDKISEVWGNSKK